MKYLILILIALFFSNICFAENWLNHSKILSGSIEAHSLKSDCERISGEECFDLGSNPSSVFSEITIQVDDTTRPIYNVMTSQACADELDCVEKYASIVCDIDTQEKFLDIKNLTVSCRVFVGYGKKDKKTIILDQQKLTEHIVQTDKKLADEAQEKNVQAVLKKIECGKRLIAIVSIRNSSKTLTPSEVLSVNSTYSQLKSLIETGALGTVELLLNQVVPDGQMVTQQDKDALLLEIKKCF